MIKKNEKLRQELFDIKFKLSIQNKMLSEDEKKDLLNKYKDITTQIKTNMLADYAQKKEMK